MLRCVLLGCSVRVCVFVRCVCAIACLCVCRLLACVVGLVACLFECVIVVLVCCGSCWLVDWLVGVMFACLIGVSLFDVVCGSCLVALSCVRSVWVIVCGLVCLLVGWLARWFDCCRVLFVLLLVGWLVGLSLRVWVLGLCVLLVGGRWVARSLVCSFGRCVCACSCVLVGWLVAGAFAFLLCLVGLLFVVWVGRLFV